MNRHETTSRAGLDRRRVLGLGVAGAGLLSLRRRSLFGLDFDAPNDGKAPILVVLQLSGGNDGLNTVIPFADPEYARARSRLAVARKDLIELDKRTGLHPNLKVCGQLFEQGKFAVVQGVGYPQPNRSHFKSMDIWHAADPTGRDLRYGWIGRALDLITREKMDADIAINIASTVPLALNGRNYKPVSFQTPQGYRFVGTKDVTAAFEKMAERPEGEAGSLMERLRRTASEAVRTSDEIRKKASSYRTPVRYVGSRLSTSLRTIAGLIAGGLSTRVYYCYHGSFDTHANQAPRHANLLRQLDGGLAGFQKDLERLGVADRVVVMAFSEFGRRVRVNGSNGTDHGVAGPVFLMGSRVRGGLYGAQPSLTDLIKGDLKHNVDFRQVYATLLESWLHVDSRKVLRGEFDKLAVLS